ncbi:Eukaryotic peptide chain release factor GTP-binding subunit [Ceratobasidium sp. 423]|nr:Eukaryotic peptide chain release factor GTP-binding subunit [Ceratobasidium sp. 423]
MATSTNSTHAPSVTSRAAPQPSTPAQLFYGARGRSGSIASSFARQQVPREQNTSPPVPPLPTSISLNQGVSNTSSHGHGHSSSLSSSFTFTRSSTFPSLASPVRSTFGPGSPVRSTFGEPLPPIRAGEPFRAPSPSTYTSFQPPQRNPSPLGGPSLSLPASARGLNRANSATRTLSNGSTYSSSPPHLHARSTSTVAEQIPLGRLPSKQSREALIPSLGVGVKNSGGEASFGAMLINAGKRASFGLVGKGEEKPPSPHPAISIPPEQGGLQVRDERDKEKGWGDSVGGIRNPRESIVRFTRARSRSHSSGGSIRSSGSAEGTHSRTAPPTKPSHAEPRRPAYVASGWQPDLGPVVRNSKGKVVKQHELIASESRWFCGGHAVTGGGTRRVPVSQRTIPGQDDWAVSDGATGYAYESTTITTPTTPEKREKTKRNRLTLIPYPFVFSVLLVLGTAGSWMGTTCVWWWKNMSPALAGTGAWLVLLVVVSMGKTAFTDPGIVPRNLDLTPVVDESGVPFVRDLYVRGIPIGVKYCITCKTYRPLRSSHCRIFLAILLMTVTAALHIYLQTRPEHGSKSFREALGGTGIGSAVVFVVCAAVIWPVGTLLGYHIRLLALNITTIEQLRNSAQAAADTEGIDGPPPNAFSLGKWTRNAAWSACRPAGLSWVEGWKPVRADQRRLLDEEV